MTDKTDYPKRATITVVVNNYSDESEEQLREKAKSCLNGNRCRDYFYDPDVLTVEMHD